MEIHIIEVLLAMAHVIGPEVVKYACSCGLLRPISLLYFCRHCLDLRCGYCVCHEVTYFLYEHPKTTLHSI